ncbi:hypothetical protein [Arthrobacter sp. RCC_34]|uniref:hypothetical protein n=1 Tax=Arthrobacter sp. RCC_34 TaxID=3239230 RepID=UPI003525D4B7
MKREERAIRSLLISGLDDWVLLQEVIWYSTFEEITEESKRLTLRVLRRLFEEGLMVPGDLAEGGFVDWTDEPEGWLDRAERELEALNWSPRTDGFWLRTTEKGDELAKTYRK